MACKRGLFTVYKKDKPHIKVNVVKEFEFPIVCDGTNVKMEDRAKQVTAYLAEDNSQQGDLVFKGYKEEQLT